MVQMRIILIITRTIISYQNINVIDVSSGSSITRANVSSHALNYGDASNNVASFSHPLAQDTSMNFGLAQDSSGNTIVNAPSSSTDGINLSIDNRPVINIANDGSIDISGNMDISGNVKFNDVIGINTDPDPNYKLDISGDVNIDGSLNIGSITDLEKYVGDISSNLANLSQNQIIDLSSSITISDNSMSFVINDTEIMNISDTNIEIDSDVSFSGIGKVVQIDGSLNLGNITDLEDYVGDISSNLANLSQNQIIRW